MFPFRRIWQTMGVKKLILLAIVALALLPVANAASQRVARVVITDISPFTVHGSGFVAAERVTVTVQASQRVVRRAAAGARGSFTMRFPTVRVARCDPYVVSVVGTRGSVVTKKVFPECAPTEPTGTAPVTTTDPPPINAYDPTPKRR